MPEVSHLPQLVKVQKESLKETVEFEWHYKLHGAVSSVGRASDCGSDGHWFETNTVPNSKQLFE